MDANKRKTLIAVGYEIGAVCGRCIHADIQPKSDWGTCKIMTYRHKKHTEEIRQLSIYRYGSCNYFIPPQKENLDGFSEFIKEY